MAYVPLLSGLLCKEYSYKIMSLFPSYSKVIFQHLSSLLRSLGPCVCVRVNGSLFVLVWPLDHVACAIYIRSMYV